MTKDEVRHDALHTSKLHKRVHLVRHKSRLKSISIGRRLLSRSIFVNDTWRNAILSTCGLPLITAQFVDYPDKDRYKPNAPLPS